MSFEISHCSFVLRACLSKERSECKKTAREQVFLIPHPRPAEHGGDGSIKFLLSQEKITMNLE